MAAWTAELAIWLIGLAGLIGLAVYPLSRLVQHDSFNYDREHVWVNYRLDADSHSDKKE
ncbi:hypothetical protein SAMN05444162_4179 [Paenibacillaceae bacterium GAS479]|nr:hypothetical protein SAMN05444162_4179 [Paenibacillaceae bacterium GAS479]